MKPVTKVVVAVALVGGVASAVAAYGQRPFCGHWSGGDASHRADHMVSRVSDTLSLNPEQRGQLEALKLQLLELREATHAQRQQTRDTALALLGAPELDQQQATALVRGKTEQVNAHAPEVVAAVAAFTDSLSTEQRAELQQLVRHRLGGRGHHGGRE